MTNKLLSPWLAIITLMLLLIIRIIDPAFVESVRLRYFDQLITTKESSISEQVHVVNIDDAYIKKNGQFPFPRGEYANIINDLYSRGAGLVVFNIYMPDADRFGQDRKLEKVLKQYPVILPHVATNDNHVANKYLPFRPGVSVIGGDALTLGIKYENIAPNIQSLNDAAAGVGIVNTIPEIDGVTRRIPTVVNSKGQLYPSIGLETLRVASGDPSFQVKVEDDRIQVVRIPQFGKINTDELGRVWIDPTVKPIEHSLINLPKTFNNGLVIVGLTAVGLNNPVATAAGAVYPHYLQATILDTLLSGSNISRPDWAMPTEILIVLMLAIVIIILSRWKYAILPIITIILSLYYSSLYVFSNFSILLDGIFPIIALSIVYGHAYTVKFISELNQKLQIKKQFGSYVNPTIVEHLQKHPEYCKVGGEEKMLTVVMTDMRNFTALGASYGDEVEEFTDIMNEYMTYLSVPVLANDGTLIKFIGDASLHVHGAPIPDDKHAIHAVKTAIEMVEAVEKFNEHLELCGKPPVGMGAGVNTGLVIIGNIGAKTKFGYDVLGDTVSTASRLEGQSKAYGVKLVIGPETATLVKDEYDVFELDNIAVKGRTEPLRMYTIEKETEEHRAFLKAYYNGQWVEAIRLIAECKIVSPMMSAYYNAMEERLLEGVPSNWQGYYIATSK